MAYAAVISVFNAIHNVLESPRITITSSTRRILLSAKDQVWLRDILSRKWCGEVVAASDDERIIIEEARSLQDAIEFAVYTQSLHQSRSFARSFSLNLDHLKQDVDRFVETAKKMKGRIDELWERNAAKVIEQHIMEMCVPQNEDEEDVSASANTEMVGLRDEFHKIRDALAHPSVPHTFKYFWQTYYWISGMAGVGKTMIAERVYHDPSVRANFECWAFVRVGQEYWIERILRSLNAQRNRGDDKTRMRGGDNLEDLRRSLDETLRVKRFLIVLDDVWDDIVLEYVLGPFSNKYERMGKRILVTSSIEPNYPYFCQCLKLRFLNEDESWELLKRKVFLEGVCPIKLVEPGKKIAKKCGGLPLLINALAPLLLEKAEKNPESWNRVAEKTYSLLEEASLRISEVLLSSYNYIDEIHKLCFLYLAAFPQSHVVFCSMINDLWIAEGFYDFITPGGLLRYEKSNAFSALLYNNLVISDHKKSWSSEEFKACSLHCAYWYVNKRVAKDNGFLYIMNSYADCMDDVVRSHHRLAIQTNVLLAIEEVFDNISSISTIRSLLCTGDYHKYQVPLCRDWKLLRVLDVVTIRFYEFPIEVVKLVLLSYLALTCNAILPSSISKLWNLRSLIVRQHWRVKRAGVKSFVPVEIWDLQELIHLEITGRNLPEPPHPGVVLPKLKKLIDVGVESCTNGVLGNIPKLKKLRIQIELAPNSAKYWTCFFNVKSFQCKVMNPTLLHSPPPLSNAIFLGIQKLSLSGFGYPWEEMSKIAKLPKLRVPEIAELCIPG